MDLFTYLSSKPKPSKKTKGKKRKRGKIRWGTPHPRTGFKSYANKPQTQLDKLLTTMTANLLQSPQDKARQKEILEDYGYVIPIEEAKEKVKKKSTAPEGFEDLEAEAARKLAKGKIKEKDIDAFIQDRSMEEGPMRSDFGGVYNLDEMANDYGKKWEIIDRELEDLLNTLKTGGGVDTMRKEALQDLKKKRSHLLRQGLEQEEFMLIGLTDSNKTYRNKFKDTFGKGQLVSYQRNINGFSQMIQEIDDLLDMKQQEAYDFDLKEALSYSPQEAQEELNLLNREVEQLSPPTNNLPSLGEMIFSN